MVLKRIRFYISFAMAIGMVAVLLLGAGYFSICCIELEVWDVETKQLLLTLPVKKGETFFIEYTHSTAKTIIEEHFRIDDDACIVATCMVFESGGAGIPDVTPTGAQFRIRNDGRFMIENINKKFLYLKNIRVAFYYPYKLILNDKIYGLDDIARGRLVDIRVQSLFANNVLERH